jgi:hypothetical protein
VDHAGSLNKRTILRRVVGNELMKVTDLAYSISFNFLDEDRGGNDRLDSIVARTAKAERVGIELVYNISRSITVSKARCVNGASLVKGAGKALFRGYEGTVYRVTDRSADAVGRTGVKGRSAEIQEESATVLFLIRMRKADRTQVHMPSG